MVIGTFGNAKQVIQEATRAMRVLRLSGIEVMSYKVTCDGNTSFIPPDDKYDRDL